ncbi:MAG TPA: choice-of-anchor D domain-containing protein, partial [Edaphobacter sp.]|nr:choice-of-anchor D domain-containing protein [Edaphobacter sp.]
PAQPGTRTGTLSLNTSLTSLPLTAALTGIGAQSQLQISPSSLNFGSVTVGTSATLPLTLANTGTASLNSLALGISGDYTIAAPCALTTLAPGSSCSVTITFAPTATGTRAGTLTVASTDRSSPAVVALTGTGKSGTTTATGTFTLTVGGGNTSTITVKSGEPASYNLALTPQDNFAGTVVLNCTPITPGQYATCSLLPSSVILNGSSQNAIATINTVTEATTAANHTSPTTAFLCLLPAAILFFRQSTRSKHLRSSNRSEHPGQLKPTGHRSHPTLWLSMALITATLFAAGCGSGGTLPKDTSSTLRYTPPGTYQYQVTASSTTGQKLTQTVTLNLVVTAQ